MIEYRLRFPDTNSQVTEEDSKNYRHHRIIKDDKGEMIVAERYAIKGILERRVEYSHTTIFLDEQEIPVVIKRFYDANYMYTGGSIWFLTSPPRLISLDKDKKPKKIIGAWGTIFNYEKHASK